MTSLRIQSQLDTPKSWILGERMFRIKSWEIEKEEIHTLIASIVKGPFHINQINNKEGELKGITLLYINNPEDVEIVRKTLLITSSGTELRKISHIKENIIDSKTIKTTAPIWVTANKVREVFSKYNSDFTKRTLTVDKKVVESVEFPVVRFYPTIVDRNGKSTKVNVVYIEFSPEEAHKHDSFIALSMEHRCKFTNNISKEEATLIFDKWTVEKIKAPIKTEVVLDKIHE